MKRCSKCNKDKELSEFRAHPRLGNQPYCVECNASYSKAWYQKNKESHKRSVRLRKEAVTTENKERVFQYLLEHPCVDCGEVDTDVLQFDHRDRDKKSYNVSDLVTGGYRWPKVQSEIDKCDVRCAHCHIKRTLRQMGWSKRPDSVLLK